MPYNEEMSWDAAKRRWHRMHRGTMYRVTASALATGMILPTRDGTRKAANDWWRRKLAELDGPTAAHAVIIEELEQTPALRAVVNRGDAARRIVSGLEGVGVRASAEEIEAAVRRVLGVDAGAEAQASKLRAIQSEAMGVDPAPPDRTVRAVAAAYLGRVTHGKKGRPIKPRSMTEIRDFIEALVTHLGGGFDAASIKASTVDDVYSWVAGRWQSPGAKKKRWGFFQRFIRFLYERDVVALPKNLGTLGFEGETRAVTEWPLDQVRAVIRELKPRFRLYAYLALNAGMNNVDIGALRKDMIDLDKGTLTRARVKTGAVTVTYRLWPETVELLRECWSDHPTLVLTSSAGTELVRFGRRSTDLLGQQWARAGVTIPLKAFRSIGATLIRGEGRFTTVTTMYLANRPEGLTDRHYAAPPAELLGQALDWLRGKILG